METTNHDRLAQPTFGELKQQAEQALVTYTTEFATPPFVVAAEQDDLQAALMRLAISIYERCDEYIAWSVRHALALGAKRSQIKEAIGVALMMAGGPAFEYGSHALQAFDTYEKG